MPSDSMLLWPESLLPAFHPYPPDHPLARRLKTSIIAPAPPGLGEDARLQSLQSPLEAELRPGDVLYFPMNWVHHTEALRHHHCLLYTSPSPRDS